MLDMDLKIKTPITPLETVAQKIFFIRGQKVMLDADLAEMYGVTTIRLNEQVRRNRDRFPLDFMFQLTKQEFENLISQIAISSWGGRRFLPYAFTEHGVAMLSSVLRSKKALQVNILIIRSFIKIREILASNKELSAKVEELEREQTVQNKHINAIYSMINKLIEEPVKVKGQIGFSRG